MSVKIENLQCERTKTMITLEIKRSLEQEMMYEIESMICLMLSKFSDAE